MKQTERKYLGSFNLVSGATASPGFDIPLGAFYDALNLRIEGSVIVTGAPAGNALFEAPLLELVNKIFLRADLDGIVINAPSKAVYLLAAQKAGTLPRISQTVDPNTAGTYNISAHIPLLFSDPRMSRPEDTIIASSRYTRVDSQVGLGTANDMYKTIATQGTVALGTFTCYVETEQRAGRATIMPLFLPRFEVESSYKLSTAGTTLDIGRAPDKAIKRVHIITTSTGATVTPTKNAQGDKLSSVISSLSLKDENKYYVLNRRDESVLDVMKIQSSWDENLPAGNYVLDLVEDLSNLSALPTGDKGTLALEYAIDAAAPANSLITACSESIISLKGV